LTVAAWVKIAVDLDAFSTICRLHSSGGGSTCMVLGMKGNGTQPAVFSPNNTTGVTGADLSVGVWTYLGFALAGSAVSLYRGTTPGTLVKTTGTVAPGAAPDGLTWFGRSVGDGSEYFNGSIAYGRIWQATLSDVEMAAESQVSANARTADAFEHWPFNAASLLTGVINGRNLSAGSTSLTADTDPTLSSGLRPSSFFHAA
jgi:hypothetical protein